MTSLYDLPRRDFVSRLAQWGFPAATAGRLWRRVYREGAADAEVMQDLPPPLRERLLAEGSLDLPAVAEEHEADLGATRKYLLELNDGQRIETVLMQCRGRVTACLSSQAGCALGCVFCATGQIGFGRNLTAGEIVAQAVHVQRAVAEFARIRSAGEKPNSGEFGYQTRLRNVVLMGMGEPLLNYDAVMRAIEILGDGGGLAIAGKQTTLSTVGVVPGIIRLADERRTCSLAVSLHAATQRERAALVPSAAAWPLGDLMAACRYYVRKSGRRILFEWTLIAGTTDSADQARDLADLVCGIPCQINLIQLNPTAGFEGTAGTEKSLHAFQALLRHLGLPVTIRRRRGTPIAAGCGQLAGDMTRARHKLALSSG